MTSVRRKHILLLTFPGYGHIIPTISLAKCLLPHHKITFGTAAFTLENIRKKGEFSQGFEDQVDVIGIDDGIPPGTQEDDGNLEAWNTLASVGIPRLQQFFLEMPASTPPVTVNNRKLLDFQVGKITTPVDLVIGDVFLTEHMSVLAQRNIPYYIFICSALGPFTNYLYVTENTPTAEMDELESFFVMRPECDGRQPAIGLEQKTVSLSINSNLEPVKGFIVNSCIELEEKALKELKSHPKTKHLDYYFVGPVMPEAKTSSSGKQRSVDEQVKSWLDRKPERSVVYISFGSVSIPNEARLRVIGEALLKLGKPFIFALREQQHSLLPKELQTGPDGLGLLLPWAPQKVILDHPAVGVFVSHCGWNSTIESIFNGKPVVGWPCFIDQLENALSLQENGMGRSLRQIDAAYDNGVRPEPTVDVIVEAIEQAGSQKCAETAKEWERKAKAAVAPGGSSWRELERFVNDA